MTAPPPTRWGRQPAADLLIERGITVAQAAERLHIKRKHLIWALIGVAPPKRKVALGLADLLDVGPLDLFTPQSLRAAMERESAYRAKQVAR